MTEQEAVAYIEKSTWSATRLGLGRTRELLARLGDPQKRLRFLHITGSNGKGSVCAMLERVLREAGYRTGLYTSPHLRDFRERIRVDGKPIPALAPVTERVREQAEAMADHPSQFELSTAAAMLWFAKSRCDAVVLEVGMGGALDSTNAIDAPELAVIANIGLEHTEYLGSTLAEIAETKAGILKPGCSCACYPSAPEALQVVRRVCGEQGIPLRVADFSRVEPRAAGWDGQAFLWDGVEYRLALNGPHQLFNAALALTGLELLRERGWAIPEDAVRRGLARVSWPGRLEALRRSPLFVLDGGHNPQCAEALARSLNALLPGQQVVFLIGVLADKDYRAMLDTLRPFAACFVCTTPDSPRSLRAEELAACLDGERHVCADPEEALRAALSLSEERGVPCVAFGSLYLAGVIRDAFLSDYGR